MTGPVVAGLIFLAFAVLNLIPPPARAGPPRSDPGVPGISDPALMMDLLGAMLTAGAPLTGALAVLARSCDPPVARRLETVRAALVLGTDWDTAWRPGRDRSPSRQEEHASVHALCEALRFAGTTGAPSAAILHAHAAQLRRRRNREAEKRAAALGVRLVVPLGLCALPAFVCLGVVPVLLALVPALG